WAYRYFKGKVDDVRIYNVALNDSQVMTAMTSVPTGPVAGLVGYWNLDEGAGQTVYDLSGNNNHGILGNSTAADSADPVWYDVTTICPRQRTYYVDAVNGNDSYSGLTPTTAFKTIQRGINVASNGDTVLVLPGQYVGTGNKELDFTGKAITVRAQDGPANTVINCQGSGRAFYFHSGEGPSSVVNGFGITGGSSTTGAAIYCTGAGPTISNCWIYGNNTTSTNSGIVYCYNNGNAILTGCVIYSNSGASAAVRFNNSAGQMINCLLFGNSSTSAGGAIRCDNGSKTTTITNCTVVANSTTSNGGGLWVRSASVNILNSIFWANQASAGGHQLSTSSPAILTVNYSDVQGGRTGVYGTGTVVWGTGNLDQDPLFADPTNFDYHLKSARGRYWPAHQVWVLDDATSPCIDAGDPTTPVADEPQPNGNRINMGAYGGTAYASLSPTAEGGPLEGDVNHDGIIDFDDLFTLIDMWLSLYMGQVQLQEPL
ncbi:MAG: hypothetical protein QHH07_02145, partial [Sedimentisphaerales bacterium]|nr:hypothetical protein [Sedimentisphaerales bacterium]